MIVLAAFFVFLSLTFIGNAGWLDSDANKELPVSEKISGDSNLAAEESAEPQGSVSEDGLGLTDNPGLNGYIEKKTSADSDKSNNLPKKEVAGNKIGSDTGSAAVNQSVSAVNETVPGGDGAREKEVEIVQSENMYPAALYIGSEKFGASVLPRSTVYDLMDSLKNKGALSFSGKNYSGIGFFVEEINGIKNNPKTGEFWIYYINNKPANVGISGYELKPGDVISWKYENAENQF